MRLARTILGAALWVALALGNGAPALADATTMAPNMTPMVVATPGSADGLDRAKVEAIVHDYIMAHPEVLMQSVSNFQAQQRQEAANKMQLAAHNVKPVTDKDHIRGSLTAPIKLIEFSDFECPFCKQFHQTLRSVLGTYVQDGEVAWVYRHSPIDQLHPKARREAAASECVASIGGEDAFWKFADKIFEVTPSNNRLDPAQLPDIAAAAGVDKDKFNQCLQADPRGGQYADLIEGEVQDAENSGMSGTPYSILVGPTGQTFGIDGSVPPAQMKSMLDAFIAQQKK